MHAMTSQAQALGNEDSHAHALMHTHIHTHTRSHKRVPPQAEDLNDENSVLRRRAGLGEGERVDLTGLRMQREASVAQLRSLNALLERQVGARMFACVRLPPCV